jgi:glucose-6-phosphate isomerase
MTLETSPAWRALAAHAKAEKPAENKALTQVLDGAEFDFSKSLIAPETLDLLIALARQQNVAANFAAMMAGEKINITENRAVLHTALRAPGAPAEIAAVRAHMKKIASGIRADKGIKDVIHIGIGGSDLGPRLVCHALAGTGPKIHFVANADPFEINAAMMACNPATTRVIAVSKTFTTPETLQNLSAARSWLSDDSKIIAISANPANATAQGIAADNVLPFWDYVGGRFSLWSSVGLSIAIHAGYDAFADLLYGAARMDSHVSMAPLDKNIPVLMALATLWYRNFKNAAAYAVLPYAQALEYLPAYLQQLEMESNGKRVDREGVLCAYDTAPVTFGMTGTNAQHAFMQMVHQGTGVIPCDFIGLADGPDMLMANMRAQAQALLAGTPAGTPPHGVCPGMRPSTTITLPTLNARMLGLLLAAYEHKTAALGFLWNINSFDQFGVELGKTLAKSRLAR